MQENYLKQTSDWPIEDQRSVPRQRLLLRTGKLVSKDKELICVVRDVSVDGFKAKLFQPIPMISECDLVFANDTKFTVRKIWEESDQAGFEFTESIDLSEILSLSFDKFPKRGLRINIDHGARISDGNSMISGRLLNISQSGICISCSAPLPRSEKLFIRSNDLPLLNGRLRWSEDGLHGIMLSRPLTMDELTKFAS